jgi:N-formylglutamate amidohydrolase
MSIVDTHTDQPERAPGLTLPAYTLSRPSAAQRPVIFASPHSGRHYPDSFLQNLRVPLIDLRQTEDAYVDELFSEAPDAGASLLHATYSRSFVDLNRDSRELDPAMFAGDPPGPVAAPSVRVEAGLGCFPRIGARGETIYAKKLSTHDGLARLSGVHEPYHRMLATEIAALHQASGCALLIDCHSMPSAQPGRPALPDFVLGDRFGSSCTGQLTSLVERALRAKGYTVVRNAPYAGGYTTRRYGRPKRHVHALQIEINRQLYLDEKTVEPHEGMANLRVELADLSREIVALSRRLMP